MQLVKSRWTAFFVHLLISLLVFIVLGAIIALWWFPGALISASGGWDGVKIVAAVDLVLGPLLTLVVYNITKPARELMRDLSIIVAFQLVCLAAGVYIVESSRPELVVHVFDTFYSFTKQELEDAGVDLDLLDSDFPHSPKILYTEVPDNPMEISHNTMMVILDGRTPFRFQQELYRSFYKLAPTQIDKILHGKYISEKDCYLVKFESLYRVGEICFHPQNHSFSNFKAMGG